MRNYGILVWVLAGVLACVTAAFAQEDSIPNPYSTFATILTTIVLFSVYLVLYAAGLMITLGYLNRFQGVDVMLLLWIAVLWLGGMGINFLADKISPQHPFLAALITMPLIFGWSMLINTRSWADLTVEDAWKVSLVLALICAPYFGPTWQVKPPPKPQPESRISVPVRMTSAEMMLLVPETGAYPLSPRGKGAGGMAE
ncbi:MAG: hypothetical protein ACYDBB_12395 [Armatimonadota bacterium]